MSAATFRMHPAVLTGTIWSASLLFLLAAVVVRYPDHFAEDTIPFLPIPAAFSTVGSFLAWRRPQLIIGWLLAGWGLVMSWTEFASGYVERGIAEPGTLPGIEWLAWLTATIWHPAFALLVFLLLLFPNGRLPSPRWRRFAVFSIAVYSALAVATAVSPAALKIYYPDLDSPLPIPDYALIEEVQGLLLAGQLLLVATAAVTLLLRLRKASGTERRQIQWFVYAVVLAVATFVASIFVLGAGYLFPVFGLIPVTAAIAILRYRLYDLDRIINRTLVYGLLTAILAAVYFGLVVGLQELLTPLSGGSDLAIALTTLAVAALFLPARGRIQAIVDRRFNRRSYDAARTIDIFASRLREEIDLDTLRYEVLAVLDETMQPSGASLWLREPSR